MNKEKILGFDVITYNQDELIQHIFEDYSNNEQLFIVNINPEIAVANYKNEEMKNILNKQKYQIPDGSGIVWASKKNKGSIKERVTGIDLMLSICKKSQEYKGKIYLYGGTKNIAEKAKEELEKKYPSINIVGTSNGYCDESTVVEKIKEKNPDILFIGTGSPKQENFIINNKDMLKNVRIMMPVGGSFDVISNSKKRAPNWIIKYNLEWLYRAFQEPKRILRQMRLVKFICIVLKDRKVKT